MRRSTEREICGTCAYWTGNRKPVFDGKGNPKIDIVDKEGICLNAVSRFVDEQRNNERHCKHYSKWTEIL